MKIEDYYYREEDARRFTTEATITNVILLVCFILSFTTTIDWWILAIIINIVLVRWMLAIHELFHIQDYEQLNKFVRLIIIPFSPINIGYGEYRTLHMGHHKETANENDPDAFHIRGGHLKSFFGAFFFPEGCTLNYIKNHYKTVNWTPVLFRFWLFMFFAAIGGMAFWITWLLLRINYAISIWVFFHHLHYRQGEYGTFELPLPGILKQYFVLMYGKPAVSGTMHHDIHHQHPRVAAIHLEKLRGKVYEELDLEPAGAK